LNGSSATAIGYSGMADIEVKVQGQGVALGDHQFDLHVSTGPVLAYKNGQASAWYIARFILIGLCTGTRAGAIASASPYREDGRSYVDWSTVSFIDLRKARQPPKNASPRRPCPSASWRMCDAGFRTDAIKSHFVEFNGAAAKSVKTGFRSAVRLARLSTQSGKVTPHTLRHTAAIWLMQRGADRPLPPERK
jgi:integrase